MVQLLLAHGAKVDLQANKGATALMAACAGGHEEVAQVLLPRNAKVNLQDKNGMTALTLLCAGRRIYANREMPKLNLAGGANFELRDDFARTAFDLACCKRNMAIATLLVKYGANIDLAHIPSIHAQAALTIACRNGFVEVLELLRKPFHKPFRVPFRSSQRSANPKKRTLGPEDFSSASKPQRKCPKTQPGEQPCDPAPLD